MASRAVHGGTDAPNLPDHFGGNTGWSNTMGTHRRPPAYLINAARTFNAQTQVRRSPTAAAANGRSG